MPCRSRSQNRCKACWINEPLCVCGLIAEMQPELRDIQTRVIVLMHHREKNLTTSTARLAALALSDCEIRLRGEHDKPMVTEGLVSPLKPSLLLYPCEDAVELTPHFVAGLPGPVTLIVPDGSWRQASKVAAREPGVVGIPRVKLPAGPPSNYRLRREPNAESVSTFEAIARALGVLEGPGIGPAAQRALERLFDIRVERSLWGRGQLRPEECLYPIPEAAFEAYRRHGAAGGLKSIAIKAARKAARDAAERLANVK